MIMPVCVSLVISLVTNPACCHGHQLLTEQRQSGSVGGVNFFSFFWEKNMQYISFLGAEGRRFKVYINWEKTCGFFVRNKNFQGKSSFCERKGASNFMVRGV